MDTLPEIKICGFKIHALTEEACVTHVLDELDAGRGGFIVTPNLDHMRRLVLNEDFAQLCRQADVVVADGMPLIWAAWLQGTALPERVAGSSLISTLSAGAARRGRSIFLLGGSPGTAETAASVLSRRFQGLKIAGTLCPEMGFESVPESMDQIAEALQISKPDVIFVGLGSPKQEQLIAALRARIPGAWWLGIGVSFSFLSGRVHRAPRWMQRVGLEWVHRLLQEPNRLARRYLIEDMPFAIRLFATAIRNGSRKRN